MNKVEVRRPCGGWKTEDGTTQKAKLGNTKFENPKIRGVIKFEEGDEIEVKWRSNPEKEYLWYPAIIQNINWDYFVCEFKHKGNTNRDIFERPMMRLRNPNPIIKNEDFYTAEIDIPEDLHDFCYVNTHCHDEFKRAIKAVNIEFGNGVLRIMTTYDLTKKLDVIKDLHVKQLYEKMILSFRLNQVQEELERNKAEAIIDKFSVQSDLLKLMKTSPNISKARSLEGIIEIEIREEDSEVIIFGENCDIVNAARELIEFEEKNYVVPRSLVSRIIGQKGKQIQEIIDRSNIAKVRFPSDHETRSILNMSKSEITKNAIIILIGTKQANESACTMMDYLVGSLNEIQAMHKQHRRLDSQLEKIKSTHLKTNQSETRKSFLSNQNSSGYSSDSSRTYSTTSSVTSTQKNRRRGGRRGRARKNSSMSDYQSDLGESAITCMELTGNLTGTEAESDRMEVANSNNQTDDFKNQTEKVEEWLHSNSSQTLNRVIEDIQEDEIEVDDFRSISCWADDPVPMDESFLDESSYGPGDKIDQSGNRCDSPFPSDQSESDSSSKNSSSLDSQSSHVSTANSFSQSDASFSSQKSNESSSTQKSTRKRNRRTKSLNMMMTPSSESPLKSYSELAKTKSKIEIEAEKAAKEAQIRAEKERQKLENQEERLIITLKGSKWAKTPKN